MLKKSIIATVLALVGTSAIATDYYVVVPVKNRVGTPVQPGNGAGANAGNETPPAAKIEVVLNAASLQSAEVGQAYAYDFRPTVQVLGDPQFNVAGVFWAADGLPDGLILDAASGVLTGIPTTKGNSTVTVTANYKSQSGQRSYQLAVEPSPVDLVQFSGYRAWSDGSMASSCADYRNPTSGHRYQGATGDGVYRITTAGRTLNVACDMTADGGGWTLVFSMFSNSSSMNWWGAADGQGAWGDGNANGTFKVPDSLIQNLTRVALRLKSSTYATTRFVKPTCRYAHSALPTVENGCGTTYADLDWSGARNVSTTMLGGWNIRGISDTDGNKAMYFTTNAESFAPFAGNALGSYKGSDSFAGGASVAMWAK